jgi:hypothetical protein
MKLEQQVTSLEISKRLKELGVKQESLFDWVDIDDNEYLLMGRKQKEFDEMDTGGKYECISAFTVAELGEMLLEGIDYYKMNGKYHSWYETGDNGQMFIENTEANARGKMLIYLLENKLINLTKE